MGSRYSYLLSMFRYGKPLLSIVDNRGLRVNSHSVPYYGNMNKSNKFIFPSM